MSNQADLEKRVRELEEEVGHLRRPRSPVYFSRCSRTKATVA